MRIGLIILLAAVASSGCKKESSTVSSPGATAAPMTMPVEQRVNEFLLDAAHRHKLDEKMDGDWIVFSPAGVKMNAGIGGDPTKPDKPDSDIVQVDFCLLLPDGRMVVQEVVGWAKD